MHVKLLNQPHEAIGADIGVVFLTKEAFESDPHQGTLKKAGFKAEQDQVCPLHEHTLIYCGIDSTDADSLRSAATAAVKALCSYEYATAKTALFGIESIQPVVEGFLLGSYQFDVYKSDPKPSEFKELFISADTADDTSFDFETAQKALDSAIVICEATNFTRDLVNTTPEDMTPQALGVVAEDLAKANNLECAVLDEQALEEEDMNAMLSVGRASDHKPRLIHLAYKPENAKKRISLVGKGLTYDSGGLSLKPSTSMVTMKMDKAGACAVLGMLKAVSELQLPIEVHGFVGAAENMVAGNAYKPDDVLKAKNGKTIEVRNTDAEGRLVLADVLAYAQQEVEADYLFDYATLTGACMVALGPYTTGVMGHNSELKHQIYKAADTSGELVGTLPFNKHLKKLIKSEIADICNIGSKPYGGAITAALFLDHFVDEGMKEKWLHFDIAGPAYTESPWDCNPHGG
ncbi:MAG: leucyl aminopeptidase, partial [Sulfurimonadaceae bacterium]|nr:leucyl aminopeptidase [Sulfurimonadaceae bacterium]